MLTEIKHRVQETEVKELLSCSVFPDPEAVDAAAAAYEANRELSLYGYVEEGELIALIGLELHGDNGVTIRHLAVDPLRRGEGYGRGILLEVLEQLHPVRMTAETDEEGVNFYRNVGFIVESLGEAYPGVERFRCVYEAEWTESD
ncbi:GNAT family N-acetyltransferase [Paenibacillus gansuensis]|uniref:GNAT family N-acetyltransferase n=1 Tax=Paenibacillus gansuensis TaxID=306542 RepID=A0ABW5PC80_9BACL